MFKPTSSDLSNETARTTGHLKEHKLLIASYKAGVYCLSQHLDPNSRRTRQDSMLKLFGDPDDKEHDKAKGQKMFPRFAALDKEEALQGALTADVTALFVQVREVAFESIAWSEDFVYHYPMPESKRPNLDEKTKRCTDFFDRYSQAQGDMKKIVDMSDDILLFTQLAARYGFAVPPAI